MFDWRIAVFAAFMICGLLFVGDMVYRAVTGRGLKAYALILPLYWTAFYGLVALI